MVWDFYQYDQFYKKYREKLQMIFLILISFLLAKSIFFSIVAPFFLPFWAYILLFYPKHARYTLVSGLIGAFTLNFGQFIILLIQVIALRVQIPFLLNKVPLWLIISGTTLISQLLWQTFYYMSLPDLELLSAILLEVICTVLFIICIQKTHESISEGNIVNASFDQITCMSIVAAVTIQGAHNMQIGNLNLSIVLIHLCICAIAYVGLPTTTIMLSAVFGCVYGISNLSFSTMISLYVVTGIAVSFGKMYGKFMITVISLVPSIAFFFYDTTLPLDKVYFTSIALAITLFVIFIPRLNNESPIEEDSSTINNISISRDIDVITPIQRFQKLFQLVQDMLQKDIRQHSELKPIKGQPVCQSCVRYSYCFEKKENDMQALMERWQFYQQTNKVTGKARIEQLIAKKCIKPSQFTEELAFTTLNNRLHLQFKHGQEMLSLQLRDFIKHLEKLIYELQYPSSNTKLFLNQSPIKEPYFEYKYETFKKSKLVGREYGDAYKIFPLNEQFVAILLSDGMGHSSHSHEESERLVSYMQQFMKYSIDPEIAMHTIHYFYMLQNSHDMFATLDVGIIDLHEGKYYGWKAGGMSTYIVRGYDVFKLNSFSPPIGAMPQFYVEMGTHDLKSNDMIFIVSDGIFSDYDSLNKQEQHFMNLVCELIGRKLPIRSLLYELMDRYEQQYPLMDDCTIIAFEVKHIAHQWKVIQYDLLHQ